MLSSLRNASLRSRVASDQRARVGRKVKAFYESWSFPGFEEFETPEDLVEKARQGGYARALDEQIPLGAKILDAGCGTGQLAIFLSLTKRTVIGADFSFSSLKKANDFKNLFNLSGVQFAQMDLFAPAIRGETFDYIFCNGVLHHTADAYLGFQRLCAALKEGGYIVVGLYNTYGRMLLNLRKAVFRATGGRLRFLDYFMRQRSVSTDKKMIWYMDQYRNPHEQTFTVDVVLRWFAENHVDYVNSVP